MKIENRLNTNPFRSRLFYIDKYNTTLCNQFFNLEFNPILIWNLGILLLISIN
jgi:hypothetical protein